MRRNERTAIRLLAVFLVFGLFAAACGDDDAATTTAAPATTAEDGETTTTAGDTTTAPTEDTTTTTSPPATGGTLRVSLEESINSIDVLQSIAALASSTAMRHVFDTLVTRTPDGEIVPSLALSWEQPDENTWIFQLRDDAVFHDGNPVTAEDVVAMATALRDGGYPVSPLWADVTGIEATDDHTVTFTTEAPVGTMLAGLSLLYIVPAEHIIDNAYDRPFGEKQVIGSGPFKVESFVLDDRMVLSANEDYWGGRPSLDELIFVDIPEITAKVTAILTGEIDVAVQLPPEQLGTIEESDEVELISMPSWGNYMVWFNVFPENRTDGGPDDANPLANPLVRQAMWYALDSQEIAETIFEGIGTAARGPISSQLFGYVEQDPYEYNPERARELLTEAGYPDGFSASLNIEPGFLQARPFGLAMVDYWADVGIDIEPRELERSVWIDELVAGTYDMLIATNFVPTGDADYALGRLYIPCVDADTWEAWQEAGGNRLGWCAGGDFPSAYDEAIEDAKRTTDPEERLAAYERATEIIWSELPSLWPIELSTTYAVRDRVEGFVPVPSQMPSFVGVSVTDG